MTLNKHATARFYERVPLKTRLKPKDIIKAIDNGALITFIKRITASRSMAYVNVRGINIKMVFHRKKRIPITILTWKGNFQKKYIIELNCALYTVIFHPDCYIETNSPSTLNKVFDMDNNKEIAYNHPLFNTIINKTVVQYFKERKNDES